MKRSLSLLQHLTDVTVEAELPFMSVVFELQLCVCVCLRDRHGLSERVSLRHMVANGFSSWVNGDGETGRQADGRPLLIAGWLAGWVGVSLSRGAGSHF